METEVGAIDEGPQILSGNDVMEAQFKLQEATENNEPAQRLYLKTFQPFDRDMQLWQARPESEWPLLATILANRIIMYPIHANPHTKRYLTPKHGRFTTVIYEDGASSDLPSDPQDAAAHVALRLALILAPVGHLIGKFPYGNSGRANVSAFKSMWWTRKAKT